jgi:hypothetical protein
MVAFLRGKASERKARLFACDCCRRTKDWVSDDDVLDAVECAERFADKLADHEELAASHSRVVASVRRTRRLFKKLEAERAENRWETYNRCEALRSAVRLSTATRAIEAGFISSYAIPAMLDWKAELEEQCRLLRDIFGNPFQPVSIEPGWLAWNDGAVVKLAESIYTERAFDRLPILADALEDAGCTDAAVLDHCRGPGPHVRGCWVVDLLFGKE